MTTNSATHADPSLNDRQTAYADLLVRIGLNVQPGQRVRVRAELGHRAFAQMVARAAYRAASKYADNEGGDQAEQVFHLRFDDLAQATPSVPSSHPIHPTP